MADDILARFRKVVAGALAELERRRTEVNDLNVFPVPDGDTGDNMSLTLRAVVEELDRLAAQGLDRIGRDEVVAAVARAALLGARGNSGVILSQIVRGAAEELASRRGQPVDPALLSAALARAADAAYASVREPAEGTMLTVVRAMASAVAHLVARAPQVRFEGTIAPEQQDRLLADVLERALEAGRQAVAESPVRLAALREAGVVDAGAYGLCALLAGAIAALRGAPVQLEHHAPAARPAIHSPAHTSTSYRYCTNFALTGRDLDATSLRLRLEELGDSVLVVGDTRTLRIHLHTNEPDRATALCASCGEVSRLEVADMWAQVDERRARLAAATKERPRCGVVAVASGSGVVRLFEELGAVVVEAADRQLGAPDLLAAVNATGGEEVLLLPNGVTHREACEAAARLAERNVVVVPTEAPQQGLALLVEFDPERSARDNAKRMAERANGVAYGGVRRAQQGEVEGTGSEVEGTGSGSARDDGDGGAAVAWLGDERTVLCRSPSEALRVLFEEVGRGAELVTVLVGRQAPIGDEELRQLAPPGAELEVLPGGDPEWWWLVAAE
ncbi:DAK2 domain-containing protein [Thermoleophilum album]|uniref:DhaL domain-containing protein n=1 Tax=Thermoleophilum album TaxID=29539 RepID=A0A1H6FXP4_THEAL|nr:DAK2 domain-containing protein [Thermoleophilum album]SEH15182.1 hypothetical protein SAMN02745716_1867 [Thermoleophilum album]